METVFHKSKEFRAGTHDMPYPFTVETAELYRKEGVDAACVLMVAIYAGNDAEGICVFHIKTNQLMHTMLAPFTLPAGKYFVVAPNCGVVFHGTTPFTGYYA